MGLSASQARLLSLTARQSNLEFEGQQINQQRTTLSNQSSNYYNTLLEMDVPVPPSSDDYTKIVYTFMIGGNEATVKEALPEKQVNGTSTYTVSYTTQLSTIGVKENSAYKTSASSARTKTEITSNTDAIYDENANYFVAAMNRLDASSVISENDEQYVLVKEGTPAGSIIIGANGYQISKEKYDSYQTKLDALNTDLNNVKNSAASTEEKAKQSSAITSQIKALEEERNSCKVYRQAISSDAGQQKYAISYTKISGATSYAHHTESESNITYKENINESDSNKGFYIYKSSNGNSFTTVDPEYKDSFINADLNMDDYFQYVTSSGVRFVKREDVEGNLNNQSVTVKTSAVGTINITSKNTMTDATIEFDSSGRISTITDEAGNTYTTTATTETDNDAYNDAYNQYEYNQYIYDQKQQEINASIEILQAQDKSLELRLSTLDTQHTAIQTELEAVKKVMSKNIDNSFKTFNA